MYIEIFNEVCVLLTCIIQLQIINPNPSAANRDTAGWWLISIVSSDVFVNLVLVGQQTIMDLIQLLREYVDQIKRWFNIREAINVEQLSREMRSERQQRQDEIEFCRSWAPQRAWLLSVHIPLSSFPEE